MFKKWYYIYWETAQNEFGKSRIGYCVIKAINPIEAIVEAKIENDRVVKEIKIIE